MTGTTCEIERSYPFQAKIPCMTLNNLIMENAEEFKAPQLAGPREKTGSTDFGNVMYDVPGCCTSRYRLIINNGFCNSFVIRSKRRLMIVPKKEKPITAFLICALSALRLCVWLFDNRYIQLSCGDQCFMLAFGTVQWEVFKNCIFSYSYPCFRAADWTQYPFLYHYFAPFCNE